ncbi:MAG TPA: choice-of-anchor E domain-containing protein [Pseudomonadales bacterium]|nr:choice-of-anchor E domain-containing protein [Pseudomonadales bacterium]
MKTIFKTWWAGTILLAAWAAQSQSLTYSNSITLSGGNPANVMAFDLPQFNPANGTLDGVTLTMYSAFQNQFTYDGVLASGKLTFTPTNSLSFLYHGSGVLAQQNAGGFTFNAGLPSHGGSLIPEASPVLDGQSIFSDALDLANFTGTGDAPLSAEYYFLPTVTWTSGTVTWSANSSATMAAVVTYHFEVVPEPGVAGILCLGGLAAALYRPWFGRKRFAPAKRTD